MLSQADIAREQYEARRKGQLDYLTDMRAERRIGFAEGRVEGKFMGQIQVAQGFLKCPVSTDNSLDEMPLPELDGLYASLKLAARSVGIEL